MASEARSTRAILALVILSVIVAVAVALTESEVKECKKASRKTLKHILKDLGVCNSEWKDKTKSHEEHSKKMGCVVRCILNRQKMLDEHGLVTNETILESVGDRAPGKWKGVTLELFHQCKNEHAKDLVPGDEFCAGYSKFGYCIQNTIADMCHIEIPF